jgi:hypothetical protein
MNDAELVQQILAGNENAFRYLVANHQRLVLHIVGRVVNQQEDVEDICQEVFLVYLGTIVGVLAVSVAMAFIWLGADWQEWQNFLVSNLAWVAGLNIMGLFILFTDRVLLRYFFFRFSGQNLN